MADSESPDDLRELAHDVGAQLGGDESVDPRGRPPNQSRLAERLAMARLESRIRQVATS